MGVFKIIILCVVLCCSFSEAFAGGGKKTKGKSGKPHVTKTDVDADADADDALLTGLMASHEGAYAKQQKEAADKKQATKEEIQVAVSTLLDTVTLRAGFKPQVKETNILQEKLWKNITTSKLNDPITDAIALDCCALATLCHLT